MTLSGQLLARVAGALAVIMLTSCTWSSTSAGTDGPHELVVSTGGHADPTVSVQLLDGSIVDPPGLVEVGVGDTVVIEITADVAEQLHIHGYDILADLAANETSVVEFRANIPGQFDVEFEGRHMRVLEIRVE